MSGCCGAACCPETATGVGQHAKQSLRLSGQHTKAKSPADNTQTERNAAARTQGGCGGYTHIACPHYACACLLAAEGQTFFSASSHSCHTSTVTSSAARHCLTHWLPVHRVSITVHPRNSCCIEHASYGWPDASPHYAPPTRKRNRRYQFSLILAFPVFHMNGIATVYEPQVSYFLPTV